MDKREEARSTIMRTIVREERSEERDDDGVFRTQE